MGYWQKESEFGKKVACFKAPLGLLGLKQKKHQFKSTRVMNVFLQSKSISQIGLDESHCAKYLLQTSGAG